MAIAFPMPWVAFGQVLPIESSTWKLERFEEIARSAGGASYTRDLADPRWACSVMLAVMPIVEASRILALIELHGSARRFYLHDTMQPAPAADVAGANLAGVTVHTVTSTALRLLGMPIGYALSVGDRLSITHAPGRVSMHRVVEAVVTPGTMITPLFEVMPPPRPLAVVGQAVALRDPQGVMLIRPGSVREGTRREGTVRGMAFDAVEAD